MAVGYAADCGLSIVLISIRGQQETPSKTTLPEYDPNVCFQFYMFKFQSPSESLLDPSSWKGKNRQLSPPQCYLCPGNERAAGDLNPDYERTFVFVNDYSAVREEQAEYRPPDQDGSMPI